MTSFNVSQPPEERRSNPEVPHVGRGKVLVFLQEKMANGPTTGNTIKTFELNFDVFGVDRSDCEDKLNKLMEKIREWSTGNDS